MKHFGVLHLLDNLPGTTDRWWRDSQTKFRFNISNSIDKDSLSFVGLCYRLLPAGIPPPRSRSAPPFDKGGSRLVRFFIIDYRRKSRCLTEDFRSATNMFAQIIFREWRSRQARGGFPANINLSLNIQSQGNKNDTLT